MAVEFHQGLQRVHRRIVADIMCIRRRQSIRMEVRPTDEIRVLADFWSELVSQ